MLGRGHTDLDLSAVLRVARHGRAAVVAEAHVERGAGVFGWVASGIRGRRREPAVAGRMRGLAPPGDDAALAVAGAPCSGISSACAAHCWSARVTPVDRENPEKISHGDCDGC